MLSKPMVVTILSKSNTTTLGTEPENKDNWITAILTYMAQDITIIQQLEKDNVNLLQVK